MGITIKLAETDSEISKVCPVMKELRPHLSEEQLSTAIKEQKAQGYHVAFAELGGVVLGVAGFVINQKLAWGKHVYVDDLVTTSDSRSTGVGSALIAWLKAFALEHSCGELHLDSGVQRFAAHRFYLRHRFDIASHHFSTTELDEN